MDRLLAAPESLIHSVLVALCDDHRIQARALKYLAELQDFAATINDAKDADDDAATATAAAVAVVERPGSSKARPLKRKATPQRTQLCIRCKRAFDPVHNSPTACSYHDGDLEVDEGSDLWAGWQEDVHGPLASAENREDYPQGFVWSCCDKTGTYPGCSKGYHLAIRHNNFDRLRMATRQDSSPDIERVFEGRLLRANEFINESLLTDDEEDGTTPTRSKDLSEHAIDSNASEKTERVSEADDIQEALPPPLLPATEVAHDE
ncbi:hypothetical protein BD289DRAFT_478309 [Coniella lustricola]|uniref:C2H2-type domain-containing protein n=1 Tax=Coniella lustricola TaxID=2025994 RepID=A0A2T3AN47_9PEZI|nr:hypothetical protein BD289DRAFT_478309 [Coniella lustricola]